MVNASLPITPDERIKLYDWVMYRDKFLEDHGVGWASGARRVCLVTKILLLNGAIRLELCYEPMNSRPAEYVWANPEDVNVVPL